MENISKDVIIVHTIRGGKDPDEYANIYDVSVLDTMDRDDAWRSLMMLPDTTFYDSLEEAEEYCRNNDLIVVEIVDAVGY